ncbi:hypothetical protein EDB81DRAFT_819553 [Dactylonectria macrodidyma]|uniref:Uncharacterized protein n=1 Tax=Dactylonectria macrodidyma TaxID=307937 RepID=A0A9P9DCE6_9HYPO|nr:hypothetical protein EDB81DRAFT_819553 [Dactylonectria macrodidyma]
MPGWGLSGNTPWVTWSGREVIWLPPDFRPGVYDISKDRSGIAIGHKTGRMMVMKMSLGGPFS